MLEKPEYQEVCCDKISCAWFFIFLGNCLVIWVGLCMWDNVWITKLFHVFATPQSSFLKSRSSCLLLKLLHRLQLFFFDGLFFSLLLYKLCHTQLLKSWALQMKRKFWICIFKMFGKIFLQKMSLNTSTCTYYEEIYSII